MKLSGQTVLLPVAEAELDLRPRVFALAFPVTSPPDHRYGLERRLREHSVAPGGGNRCAGFIKDRRHGINGDDTDSTEDLTNP